MNRYLALSILAHICYGIQLYTFGVYYLIISTIIGIVVFNLAYSLYVHRTVCHKHYEFSINVHRVLGFLFNTLNFGSPASFASVHIKHHKYLNTEKDPHDPYRIGKIRAYLKFWDKQYTPDVKFLRNLLKDEIYKNQHRDNYKVALLSSIIVPFLPVVAFWVSNFLIVTVHPKGETKNLYWLKFLLWGEELHKNHHEQPGLGNHNFDGSFREKDFINDISFLLEKI